MSSTPRSEIRSSAVEITAQIKEHGRKENLFRLLVTPDDRIISACSTSERITSLNVKPGQTINARQRVATFSAAVRRPKIMLHSRPVSEDYVREAMAESRRRCIANADDSPALQEVIIGKK